MAVQPRRSRRISRAGVDVAVQAERAVGGLVCRLPCEAAGTQRVETGEVWREADHLLAMAWAAPAAWVTHSASAIGDVSRDKPGGILGYRVSL